MARPKKFTAPRTQITIYIDDEYLKQIDALVAARKATSPTNYTRSDFFHAAIGAALAAPAPASASEVSLAAAKNGVLDQILAAIGRLIRRITAAWR